MKGEEIKRLELDEAMLSLNKICDEAIFLFNMKHNTAQYYFLEMMSYQSVVSLQKSWISALIFILTTFNSVLFICMYVSMRLTHLHFVFCLRCKFS